MTAGPLPIAFTTVDTSSISNESVSNSIPSSTSWPKRAVLCGSCGTFSLPTSYGGAAAGIGYGAFWLRQRARSTLSTDQAFAPLPHHTGDGTPISLMPTQLLQC